MFLVDSLTDEELRERVVELFPLLNDICANKVQSERRQDYGKRQTRKDMMFNVGMEKFTEEQHSFILSCLITEFILSGKDISRDFLFLVKCRDRLFLRF